MKPLIQTKISDLDQYFDLLWSHYIEITPQAKAIHDLFSRQGEKIENDHIALRTISDPRMDIECLAETFLQLGYEKKGEYNFEEKKLKANHFEHKKNSHYPKVFISQLKLELISDFARETLLNLVENFFEDTHYLNKCQDINLAGRNWKIDHVTYQRLYEESEYAAWFAVFGLRVNHFTVFVNHLKNFSNLKDLNGFLKENKFTLNSSGGEIKGSPEVFLEQSSTMAAEIDVLFSDGLYKIPSCYYEFAKRYPLPESDGELYQGFVAKSADRIFESTNRLK